MLLIDALYVKSNGGLNVLYEVLKNIPKNIEIDLLIDNTIKKPIGYYENINIIYCKSSIFNKTFFANKKKYSKILCLGNFPGLIFYKTNLHVYNMQYFLFNRDSLIGKSKLIWDIKSLIIRILFKLSKPELLVQSEWMKIIAKKSKIKVSNIKVFPIYKEFTSLSKARGNDWIYITSIQTYKNVVNVIKAWNNSSESLTNNLYLTLNKDQLNIDITNCNNIIFLGNLSHSNLKEFILTHRPTFIQASEVESFGLNVIESSMFKLPIVTLEKPYLKSTIENYTSFNTWEELTFLFDNKTKIKIPVTIISNDAGKLITYILK